MTESMIERVAKALCTYDGHDPGASGGDHFDEGLVHWMAYMDQARAAIEAMREPLGVMEGAGNLEIDQQRTNEGGTLYRKASA